MKTVKVEVKRKHIRAGRRISSYSCPIALALHEQFPDASVACDWVNIPSVNGMIDLPLRAVNFIKKFDNFQPVKPFSFQLKYEAQL